MSPAPRTIDDVSKQLGKLSVSTACFTKLPTEMVENITSHMDLDIIRAFRLCSKSTAQLADFHFKCDYQHAIRTDFSLGDFQALARLLAKNPQAMSHIDTVSVTAKVPEGCLRTLEESLPMGAGFNWKRLGELLDPNQLAVRNWHNLLGRIGDLKHFRINVDLTMVLLPGRGWVQASSSTELSLWDVFLIAIPVISSNRHSVVSLDMFGYNFYRGNQQWNDIDPVEQDLIDQLCRTPNIGWPNLSSLILRDGEPSEMYRFREIISRAPNLKRLRLRRLFHKTHLEEIVRYASKFRLEELHIEQMQPDVNKLCSALRSVRGTLKKLVLLRVNMKNWLDFLGALNKDCELPALEEFTIQGYTSWDHNHDDLYELRFPYTPGTVGFSGPRGAKLEYTLQDAGKVVMYASLSYSGPGMQGFFSQLPGKACLVPGRRLSSRVHSPGVHRF